MYNDIQRLLGFRTAPRKLMLGNRFESHYYHLGMINILCTWRPYSPRWLHRLTRTIKRRRWINRFGQTQNVDYLKYE